MIMDERDTRLRTFLTIGLVGLTGAFGYSMGVDRTGRIQDERLFRARVYAPAISAASNPNRYGPRGADGATCSGGNFVSLTSLSHDSSP